MSRMNRNQTRRAGRHGAAICMMALGCVALPGCGYGTDSLFRPNIRTVHVETFATKEFRRDLEFLLTEAVKKRVSMDTPYRVAAKERADTVLKGEVLEVRQAAFAPDFVTRIPRDTQLTLIVRVLWQDLRDGAIYADDRIEVQSVDYLPGAGESEKFAQERAIDRMAARIVKRMYDEW